MWNSLQALQVYVLIAASFSLPCSPANDKVRESASISDDTSIPLRVFREVKMGPDIIIIHSPSDVLSALALLQPCLAGGVVRYSILFHTTFRLLLTRGGHV